MSKGTAGRGRRIEFEAFRKEYQARRQPLLLPIDDQVYELPPSMPASAFLDVLAFMREHGAEAELPPPMIMEIMREILGHELYREVVEQHALDLQELMWIFSQVWLRYMAESGLGNEPRAAATTAPSPSTSSTTGAS